jgi:hypothetical protein
MKIYKLALVVVTLAFTFTSCTNENDTPDDLFISLGDYENGIIISNEGNFNAGNASISFVSNDFSTVENNVYSNVNANMPLGDTAQSIAFNGDLAYIVVNNSDKIEVVNRNTFESVATITGFDNPRYMAISNGKGYVTAWGDFSDTTDDTVKIIDLSNNTVIESISVPHMPNQIIASDNSLYVGIGIFDYNDKLIIINSITDAITTTLTVGTNPNALVFNNSGDLYVLTGGNSSFSGNETGGKLVKVNTVNNTISSTLDFNVNDHPNYLVFENNNLYFYLNGGVYKTTEAATTLPTTPIFSGLSFYDMNIKNNELFGLDAGDYSSEGTLQVFDLTTNTQTQNITVGVIPGEVYFN